MLKTYKTEFEIIRLFDLDSTTQLNHLVSQNNFPKPYKIFENGEYVNVYFLKDIEDFFFPKNKKIKIVNTATVVNQNALKHKAQYLKHKQTMFLLIWFFIGIITTIILRYESLM